ncbi:endonuclease IV [Candidatus Woesearchaeota archaeon CG10_big_fil_rev_8_21_14_0_10_34_12]|nr:MAG: endonuclease IV [Candidatus Woesearchaeota archaeon CG10_big_fil_rev_8_21_14_0_10_34_12]
MTIRFGPAGLGGWKEAISNLNEYHGLGLRACEVAFTYGIYLKKEQAVEIGKVAGKLGIQISIHAPYWINLNSKEKRKVEESKKRILNCCEIGEVMGADCVVFHPGFYSGFEKEESFQNIKKQVLEILKIIKEKKWKIKIAPETTGKINVFGSVDEIARLVDETGCFFCIDFAHILAREKKIDYKYIFSKLNDKKLHIHFSGIEYGEKGEKRHILTDINQAEDLLENLPKNVTTIINESPNPVGDSVKMLGLCKSAGVCK